MTTAIPKRPVGRPRKVHAGVEEATALARSIAAPAKPLGIRVTISKRTRRGEDPVEEEVAWPQGWPLPDAGTIVLGKELSGWTSHLEYDLVNERVLVVLRPT